MILTASVESILQAALRTRRSLRLPVMLASLVFLLAATAASAETISISGATSVAIGTTTRYSDVVTGSSDQTAIWQVNGKVGGSAATGTIGGGGLYTPPATLPSPVTVTISAYAQYNPNVVSNTITLTIQNAVPVLSSGTATQTPNTFNYLIDVKGSAFVSGATIQANGSNLPTTFVSSTELTAPYTNPTPAVNTGAPATYGQFDVLNPSQGTASSNLNVPLPVTKVSIHGLVAQQKIYAAPMTAPDNTLAEPTIHPGYWSGQVISAAWFQLQSSPSSFDTSIIDNALALIDTYNQNVAKDAASGNPQDFAHKYMTGKLRIQVGASAPQWVLDNDGQVQLYITINNVTNPEAFPYFWNTTGSNYDNDFKNLQNMLAARYDNDPRVQEIAITACSSSTLEPYIVPTDYQSVGNLQAAGYSDANQITCTQKAPSDYAAWTNTPIDYTFAQISQTDYVTESHTSWTTDYDDPLITMQAFKQSLGSRAVLANHGQAATDSTGSAEMGLGEPSPSMYTSANGYGFVKLGGAIELQIAKPDVSDANWQTTVSNDKNTYDCTEQELFPSTYAQFADGTYGSGTYTVSDLMNWVTLFP